LYWIVSGSSNITYLEPEHFYEYGSQRVEINYGTYEIPPNHIRNGMMSSAELDVTLPCHDCLITSIQANLRYLNGTTANASNGIWLHHADLVNSGKADITGCNKMGEPFFATGNERTPVDFSLNG
jgi:hypothetical protein